MLGHGNRCGALVLQYVVLPLELTHSHYIGHHLDQDWVSMVEGILIDILSNSSSPELTLHLSVLQLTVCNREI